MDLNAILEQLAAHPGDPRWLRALAGAVGVELSRRRPDHLAAVLRAVARPADSASFEAGYAAALADVTLSFQAELGVELEEAELVRLASTSPYAEALAALAAGRDTVTAIGAAMGKTKSSASRALSVLRDAGLVAVQGGGDERARPHALTVRGRRVAAQVSRDRRGNGRRATPARGTKVARAFASVPRKK
ncbi:MAG: winged helix-turn-helix transcriptional regulator [Kofleriaceae bacterium]|nr:winged helix-turn-helix transcriptional regulator [Kofleriaceae bacterium]MCB9571585.1 winged helix-turn-helix transcriptional regulator [Kofleriaceae bacterium]